MKRPTYRAYVFDGPGQPLRAEAQSCPPPGPGEVLVRVTMCTLCGSDLHTYSGRRPTPLPTILGHEILGEVLECGDRDAARDAAGRPLRPGDRVTWTIMASCGSCFFCRAGLPQKCETLFKYGHEDCASHPLSGGLAEACLLRRGTSVFRIDEALDDETVCPASCATATVAAAFRASRPCEGAAVLVQGAGMLGLTACAMARAGGARVVIVSDVDPRRMEAAPRFGADRTVDARRGAEAVVQAVRSSTDGRGADLAIDVSGANAAVSSALQSLRVGGNLVLVGSVFPADPLPLSLERVVRGQHAIFGVHNYTSDDLATALEFLHENAARFPFASLVEKRFALDAVGDAFRFACEKHPLRVALTP